MLVLNDVSAGLITTNESTNITSWFNCYIMPVFKVYYETEICVVIVGTFPNLWFVAAILRSPELRSRMRNKIICNTLVLHQVDSAPVLCFYAAISTVHNLPSTCFSYLVVHSIQRIQETIISWHLVMLIIVFIAQIEDVNLKSKFSPWIVQVGTWTSLIIPWVFSVILVPSVSIGSYDCFFILYSTRQTLRILNTALPIILYVHRMLVAVFLRYRRFNKGHSSFKENELVSQGHEVDGSLPYIAAVIISTACDITSLNYMVDYNLFWNIRGTDSF